MPDPEPVSDPVAAAPAEPPRTIAVLGEIPFSGAALTRVLIAGGFPVRVLCPDERAAAALPKSPGASDPATVEVVHGTLDAPEKIEEVLPVDLLARHSSRRSALNGRTCIRAPANAAKMCAA